MPVVHKYLHYLPQVLITYIHPTFLPNTGILIKCPGQPGHGSQFLQNTAGEKVAKIINSFMAFREQELRRLEEDPSLALGDVTTINLTKLEANGAFSDLKSCYSKNAV